MIDLKQKLWRHKSLKEEDVKYLNREVKKLKEDEEEKPERLQDLVKNIFGA